MAFDRRSGNGQRFDDVGINRSLCQPLDIFQLKSFFLENIDKSLADDLSFPFGIGNTRKCFIKTILASTPITFNPKCL